jgi:3-oxoacyl-[acyl-carrier protein] reductase
MLDELNFSGKTALVVGGSSGIGNGIARAFLDRGAKVHVWGTRDSAGDYAGVEGSDLAGLSYSKVDVARRSEIADHEPLGDRLDILVLCQGTVVYRRGEFAPEGWDRVVSVNLGSLMDCAMKYREPLWESRGVLIIVSSISGFTSNRGNPAYAASKAGAVSLTKTLGEAWAPDGIRVVGIAPGLVDTKLTKVTVDNPGRRQAALAQIPLGRLGTPSDMAGAGLFLASPLASYVVGHTLIVDGGLTLA